MSRPWTDLLPSTATAYATREDERAQWGEGPWRDEPDKVSWTDPATGRPCLIHRGPGGALCGYAAVDPGHPLHGVGFTDDTLPDLEVHGGVTYADRCQDTPDESSGICHVPAPGAPHDVWWFGFHCAGFRDLEPASAAYLAKALPMEDTCLWHSDVYRDVAYVIGQCEALARQLDYVGASS